MANQRRRDLRRGLSIGLASFIVALLAWWPAQMLVRTPYLYIALPVLLMIVLTGIIFDIIGVAVAVADEAPFHSMAAKRVHGARQAIWLIRNAERVTSICNDVIGDIAGTISGAASAAIVATLMALGVSNNRDLVAMIVVAAVAALTVGGKAFGKGIAINEAQIITHQVGKVIYWAERATGIEISRDVSRREGRKKGKQTTNGNSRKNTRSSRPQASQPPRTQRAGKRDQTKDN